MNASTNENQKVDLKAFAEMTGFPVELIKKELLQDENTDELSLEELRAAMVSYLDSTMMEK
ncbi:MAG: hypothetical protein ACJAS4_001320 [Bacteriovoracaceae bacterium]|jgi:hypothetical protein